MFFPNRRQERYYQPHHRQNPIHDPFFHRREHYPPNNQLQSFADKGAGSLVKTLGNIQQILNLIQSTAPIVEQYGPMVKNLPALYKMMKAINATESDEKPKKKKNERVESKRKEEKVRAKSDVEEVRREHYKESKPVLFI